MSQRVLYGIFQKRTHHMIYWQSIMLRLCFLNDEDNYEKEEPRLDHKKLMNENLPECRQVTY